MIMDESGVDITILVNYVDGDDCMTLRFGNLID
jgi:hypothetical protein